MGRRQGLEHDGEPAVVQDRIAALAILPLTVILVALIAVFFVLGTPFAVDGDSMYPTLHDTDRLLITRGYDRPERGDIVVFITARQHRVPTALVKRIVGLEGDTVRMVGDRAWVNGQPEGGHPVLTSPDPQYDPFEVKVRRGHVFVLGDNRPDSNDSRYIGQIPLASIKGKAILIFTPVTRIRGLD